MTSQRKRLAAIIGPGILVAATGVGAGDLATATFTGAKLGTAVLWAVVVGAVLKYLLNEGLTRWQLATETTLLEGCVAHLGRWVQWFFLIYFLFWSYLVAIALMSACGVAAAAMFPVFRDEDTGRIVFGIVHSLVAVILVRFGGYKLFSKVMGICIGMMFCVVVITAVALHPPWAEVFTGLVIPTIPDFRGEGLDWTVALLGGVGGTLTVLCYGYWIREEGRHGAGDLGMCRLDLGVGYAMTAVFGLSMIVIGSQLGDVDGKGARLIVKLADTLETTFDEFGVAARWAFLVGAWGAFFSSLLGCWQSLPYLFTDFWGLMRKPESAKGESRVDTNSLPYRAYLASIAIVPISGLFLFDFRQAVKIYALVGAIFIPMLAAVLLYLNGKKSLVGEEHANSKLTTAILILTLFVFLIASAFEVALRLG